MQGAWEKWRAENTEAFRLIKELEDLGCGDPLALEAALEKFRGDHFALETLALGLIRDRQEFEGHEDPDQCNFGKWKAGITFENPELRSAIAASEAPHRQFHAAVVKIKALVKAGDTARAGAVFATEMKPAAEATLGQFQRMLDVAARAQALEKRVQHQVSQVCEVDHVKTTEILGRLIKLNAESAAAAVAGANRHAATMKALSFGLTISGTVGGILLAFFIGRSITRSVAAVASALADGSRQVTSAAGQVSASSQTMAETASEQAASLEETSSSLEEMASMTQRNAENAQKAHELAAGARAAADSGATEMQAMATAIDTIKASSDDIAKIIKTIDEIAFQTNILALNAAVEAARAGEAGMGFAVVADEVRTLAQRSAQAAKETAEKIEGAIANTGQGVEISRKVLSALNDIVTRVRQVNELVADVAGASREQTQGIGQLNNAVSQMDKATQSNASGAEETASSAEELNAQAVTMMESVQDLLQLVGGREWAGEEPTRQLARSPSRFGAGRPGAARRASSNHGTNGTGSGNGAHPDLDFSNGSGGTNGDSAAPGENGSSNGLVRPSLDPNRRTRL